MKHFDTFFFICLLVLVLTCGIITIKAVAQFNAIDKAKVIRNIQGEM